jgi:GTP-binding protein LepA
MDQNHIRNFCIIAHIDHGKSTLADRLLELTGTIPDREMKEQVLDSMELEREKGVTIKASAVRMQYTALDGQEYELNLIDTPGHVDFGYEVSRALAACEGALLVVDASQGIEAQTLANLYLALDADLVIIPILNKIDLASARVDEITEEIHALLGSSVGEILQISAKRGINIDAVPEVVIKNIPPPQGSEASPLKALIFDSHYDSYKGVVAYIRVFEGRIRSGEELRMMASGAETRPMEIGYFSPHMCPVETLLPGEVGYIATGLKSVRECRVGDTITTAIQPASVALAGYKTPKSMVFAGFYPIEGEEYATLKDALEKLQLNDAALSFEPETSQALNYGFRCGFLGMFHMEIVQERLEREHEIRLIATAPSVEYEILLNDGTEMRIDSPAKLPDDRDRMAEIREPWMSIQVYTPESYYGSVLELVTKRRGRFIDQEYPTPERVILNFEIPLAELIIDFYDQLKSRTRGYASLDYRFVGYRAGDLVKLEILVNSEPLDALALIVHRQNAFHKGQALVSKLKELIPRQLFTVPIQAVVDGRVISRADVKSLRKDVLAKCYGGDVTRKRKLLEQQKRGKKRLKRIGSVDIPQDAFLAVLQLGEG